MPISAGYRYRPILELISAIYDRYTIGISVLGFRLYFIQKFIKIPLKLIPKIDLQKLKKNYFFPKKLHFITFTICSIAISVSASVSADMAISISVSASVSADMKIRDIGDYRYQPIWKKADRSSTNISKSLHI